MEKSAEDAEWAARVGERIVIAYKLAGLNRNQFAQRMGVAYPNVLRWEKGEQAPKGPFLRKIAILCDVNGHWLLTGDGPVRGLWKRVDEPPPQPETERRSSGNRKK